MRRSTWWAVALLVLAVGLAGCGASTPTCDEASGLIDAGRLDRAAESYAVARERGVGGCADAGLDRAANRFRDAFLDVARGRLAEERKDIETAVTAYRAALVADVDNPIAKDGLVRLGQPVPQLRELPPVTAQPTLSPLPAPVVWVIFAIAVLLLLLMTLVAWALVQWRQ